MIGLSADVPFPRSSVDDLTCVADIFMQKTSAARENAIDAC